MIKKDFQNHTKWVTQRTVMHYGALQRIVMHVHCLSASIHFDEMCIAVQKIKWALKGIEKVQFFPPK